MAPEIGRQVDINLIGPEDGGGASPLLASAVFLALAILATLLLLPLVALLVLSNEEVNALTERLAQAQRANQAALTIPQELVALRSANDAAQKAIDDLTADLSTLSQRQAGLSAALSSVWGQGGLDVAVGSVTVQGRRVTVKGDAAGPGAISSFVDRLRATGFFSNVVIELVSGLGTALPLPTAQSALTPRTATPVAGTRTATVPSPTCTPVAVYPSPTTTDNFPQPTWETCPACTPPVPTWETVPTYPTFAPFPTRIYPGPTWFPLPSLTPAASRTAPAPSVTPFPSPSTTRTPTITPRVSVTAKASPTPRLAVVLEDLRITLGAGNVLAFSARVHNIGTVALRGENNKPSGATYTEGEMAPAGVATQWRVAVDESGRAAANAHRYRWGWSGDIAPGQARTVTGKINLSTAGTFTYCIGLLQEFSNWLVSCVGSTTIVVGSPSGFLATPQIAGSAGLHLAMAGISDLPLMLPSLRPDEALASRVGFTILMDLKGDGP